MVKPHPQVNREPRANLPIVLHKESELVLRGLRGERRIVGDLATDGAIFAQHVEREVGNLALVSGARVGVSESQQMPACGLQRPQVQGLRPLVEPRAAVLLLEERARVLLGKQNHLLRRIAGGEDVGIEPLRGEQGLHEPSRRQDPAMCGRSEEAALVIVGRDRLGIEGIDVREVRVLRIGGQRRAELLVGLEIPVELSVGGDTFRPRARYSGRGGRACGRCRSRRPAIETDRTCRV